MHLKFPGSKGSFSTVDCLNIIKSGKVIVWTNQTKSKPCFLLRAVKSIQFGTFITPRRFYTESKVVRDVIARTRLSSGNLWSFVFVCDGVYTGPVHFKINKKPKVLKLNNQNYKNEKWPRSRHYRILHLIYVGVGVWVFHMLSILFL